MIRKYVYGEKIDVESVVINTDASDKSSAYFSVTQEEGCIILSAHMEQSAMIYGLGENIRGINKRGYIYESNCSDNPNHSEVARSLYAAHNFIILTNGNVTKGLFIDSTAHITYDLGYGHIDEIKITIHDTGADVYEISGNTKLDIVRQLRRITGRSYIAPRWAFGYQQSRWGYRDEKDIRYIADMYRKNDIPIDAIYLDIDYMERFKDFTIDRGAFPSFTRFVEDMKNRGIHLVPIIDAGVKIEAGYDVYEEGVSGDYFCKNEKGDDFVGAVWPGKVHFPDFFKEDTRRWFGHKYKMLMDAGIEGFWNDMNEPAIFYSEDTLREAFEELDKLRDEDIDIYNFFKMKDIINNISNSEKDYKSFYHIVDGKKVRHDKVHNAYGYMMTRAASEAFRDIDPDKRYLMFSRSSMIGMHRYSGIWTGDNMSIWSHLLMNIKMMPSLNMCGFLYSGADLAGFGADTTEELALRWIQFGIFTPLMRNHSALGTREQELFRFVRIEYFRDMIKLRYALIPYLYSEYMKAVTSDSMMFMPLSFVYENDEHACRVEDQIMLSDRIMLAPVYEQNAAGRYVYLPEKMMMVRFRSVSDRDMIIMEAGHHYIDVALNEVVIFMRANTILPLEHESVNCVDEIIDDYDLIGYVPEQADYALYTDDGYTTDVDRDGVVRHITLYNNLSVDCDINIKIHNISIKKD